MFPHLCFPELNLIGTIHVLNSSTCPHHEEVVHVPTKSLLALGIRGRPVVLEIDLIRASLFQRRRNLSVDLGAGSRPRGQAGMDCARETLLDALLARGGRLELSDRSAPVEIRRTVELSKKAFKRAVGALYRQRRIRIGDSFIELIEPTHST